MGMEAIMLVIIGVAFATFILGVGYVDRIADAKAITYEQEQASRVKAAPVKATQPEFKQAA